MAKLRLRRFLYLDGDLTDEYLAQAEGGLYSEEDQTSSATQEKGGNVGLAAGPASAQLGKASGDLDSRARTVRQTEESGFSRLAGLLEGSESVQWLESADKDIWDQLERGEVLEVECRLHLPQFFKFVQVSANLEQMKELVGLSGESLDQDSLDGFNVLMLISQMLEAIPLTASLLGSPDFRLIAPLNEKFLRGSVDDLQGEARMFCSVERKLKENELYSIVDMLPALRNLPNRDEMSVDLTDNEMLVDSKVEAPAAIVSPIAIFR